MYNDVIDLLASWNVGWSPDSVEIVGKRCVKTIVGALWYLDPHHERFSARSLAIPACFHKFKGYNDWKRKREKCPQLTQHDLDKHVQAISSLLSQPWSHMNQFKKLKTELVTLVDVMKQYLSYLKKHSDAMKEAHSSTSVLRSVEENILLEKRMSTLVCQSEYRLLQEMLLSLPAYHPVFVNDYSPPNRFERRHWLDRLQVELPIKMYRFFHGNSLGTLTFVWKLPSDGSEDPNATAQAISLNSKQKVYSTRQMHKDFIVKYNRFVKAPTSVLRHMYKELVHDSSAATSIVEHVIDERVAEVIAEVQDPEIILDLRKNNGKVQSSFDDFWAELQKFLDEIVTPVNERRHGDTMYLPLANSIRDLREQICERLSKRFPDVT